MKAKTIFLSVLVSVFVLVSAGFAQDGGNFEVSGLVGGQINGGIDLSTTLYKRIEAGNALSYGATVGYLMGEHYGVEFQWTRSETDTRAQPLIAGPSVKLFNLTQDHYLANFLLHLTPREDHMRPFVSFGMGANDLSANTRGVGNSTRFTFALGGGAKYYMSKHLGFRAQLQWVPTYLGTTNNGGYWCDPIWGGCWLVGNSHYLHSFDLGAGITLRF
jgi:opacity protein-like surface antigen